MRVLIATDGSEFSKTAIEAYCNNYGAANDEIMIASAVESSPHIVGAPFGVLEEYYQDLHEGAVKRANAIVANAVEMIRSNAPDRAIITSTPIGPVAKAIVEEAESWGAELIVVGSHGRGFWTRVYLGSVSQAVVHHARCSVLVVRSKV